MKIAFICLLLFDLIFFPALIYFARKGRHYAVLSAERVTMDAAIGLSGMIYYIYFPEQHMAHNISQKMILGDSEYYYHFPEVIFERHIIHPMEEELLKEAFRKIDEGSKEELVESRTLEKGKYRWKRQRLTSVYDERGQRTRVIVTVLDIQNEMEAKEAFQNHLEESMYTDSGTIALYRMNLSQDKNSFYSEKFGVGPVWEKVSSMEQLLLLLEGKVRSEDAELLKEFLSEENLLSEYEKGNTLISEEFRLTVDSGIVSWVRLSVDMLENPATKDLEAVLFLNDVNQEHLMQDMVTSVAARDYDLLILYYVNSDLYFRIEEGGSHTAIYETGNFAGRLREGFEESHGGPDAFVYLNEENEEVSGDIVWEKLSDEQVLKALEKEENYRVLVRIRKKDGSYLRKRFSYTYYDAADQIVFLTVRDNTDSYLLEMNSSSRIMEALNEAKEANRAKSDFLSRMSHDIRTPMNGIIGMSNMIAEESDLTVIREYNSVIQTSADFLLGLINDILDMSKIEAGKMELHPEWCSIDDFHRYLQAMIVPLCESKQLHFKAVLPRKSEIYVDRLRFNQLFFNLLSNAVKYTPAGGNVELLFISERPVNGLLKMHAEVRDTGIGMSREFCEHIFDAFSREERTDVNQQQGTGLGLAISKQIVELFGGRIWVDSIENEGSTFSVEFPCRVRIPMGSAEISRPTEQKLSADEVDFTGKHLLLCEDNAVNAKIIMAQVKKLGMEVDWVKNGEEGVKTFGGSLPGTYDAILMDIRMPVMDGLKATRIIRSMGHPDAASIPMIALTANAFDEDKRESISAGLNRHISKPIRAEEFKQALAELLG